MFFWQVSHFRMTPFALSPIFFCPADVDGAGLDASPQTFCESGCATVTSTCCGALVDEPVGGCMRRLRCQTNTAAASTAASRQPPSARPMARPGPASWVAPGSLVAFEPTSGNGGGGGGGGNTGGLGGGSRSRREPQSLQSVPNAHIDPKAFQPPSWQTVSPAVPQVSRQIIGGGEAGGGCGGNGGGAGSTVTEPATPVKSTK